ncbi:MAG: hypothetical protein WCY19_02435 [Candidatus Gastranaerophilaceae bacterium]
MKIMSITGANNGIYNQRSQTNCKNQPSFGATIHFEDEAMLRLSELGKTFVDDLENKVSKIKKIDTEGKSVHFNISNFGESGVTIIATSKDLEDIQGETTFTVLTGRDRHTCFKAGADGFIELLKEAVEDLERKYPKSAEYLTKRFANLEAKINAV